MNVWEENGFSNNYDKLLVRIDKQNISSNLVIYLI